MAKKRSNLGLYYICESESETCKHWKKQLEPSLPAYCTHAIRTEIRGWLSRGCASWDARRERIKEESQPNGYLYLTEEQEANAKLIAAAPEMYEALREIAKYRSHDPAIQIVLYIAQKALKEVEDK